MRWLLAAAVLMAGAIGCAKRIDAARGTAEAASAAYYPLAVGNRWTYVLVTPEGKTVEEKTVQILRQESGYYVDTQGGQLTADAWGVRDQKRYLLRDPLEAGRNWNNVVSVSSVEHYQILDAGTSCQVPAGKFERCVVIEARNRINDENTFVNELTFAPGVGIVRIRTAAEVRGRRIPQLNIALKSFELAGAGETKAR